MVEFWCCLFLLGRGVNIWNAMGDVNSDTANGQTRVKTVDFWGLQLSAIFVYFGLFFFSWFLVNICVLCCLSTYFIEEDWVLDLFFFLETKKYY